MTRHTKKQENMPQSKVQNKTTSLQVIQQEILTTVLKILTELTENTGKQWKEMKKMTHKENQTINIYKKYFKKTNSEAEQYN